MKKREIWHYDENCKLTITDETITNCISAIVVVILMIGIPMALGLLFLLIITNPATM